MEQRTIRLSRRAATETCFLLILILYPFRHVNWGLDLWDTGYNYANFTYMGLEHVDSMWLFSTYLANAVGHFLTKLPFGGTLIGMNVYTGVFVSILAATGYWFCSRKLEIPPWIAFVGEFAAISLCWCPTALLYNYLTYVLFLGCVILLYRGLTEKKTRMLLAAGICLGINVFVRFSNLPEAAMILAVWAYAAMEGSKRKEKRFKESFFQACRHTMWCLSGYLGALAVMLFYFYVRYGRGAYTEGIRRLFAMTDTATDYKATSMLTGMVYPYLDMLYWLEHILVFVGAGMLIFAAAAFLAEYCEAIRKNERLVCLFRAGGKIAAVLITVVMILWLYRSPSVSFLFLGTGSEGLQEWYTNKFVSFLFYSYDSMYRSGVLFLMLTVFIGVLCVFKKGCPKQEKLISIIVVLIIFLTALGSNNGVYPSMNNLFVAAPYTLWQCVKFLHWTWKKQEKGARWRHVISFAPVKQALCAMMILFLVHSVGFGVKFVFAEATGVQDVSAEVYNNEVLAGVKMTPERAAYISELTAYIEEKQLQYHEVILYGYIPSLSFYLRMPPAFNSWCDLPSYSVRVMESELQRLGRELEQGGERPVIIAEKSYGEYEQQGDKKLSLSESADKAEKRISGDEKWQMISQFMEKHGYVLTFSNDKFYVWQ